MTPDPPYQRLTVVLHARAHAGHHRLATELLAQARRAGLAGATLLAPAEPTGAEAPGGPLRLVVVDHADTLARFLTDNARLLETTVVTLDDVTAFRA